MHEIGTTHEYMHAARHPAPVTTNKCENCSAERVCTSCLLTAINKIAYVDGIVAAMFSIRKHKMKIHFISPIWCVSLQHWHDYHYYFMCSEYTSSISHSLIHPVAQNSLSPKHAHYSASFATNAIWKGVGVFAIRKFSCWLDGVDSVVGVCLCVYVWFGVSALHGNIVDFLVLNADAAARREGDKCDE